MENITKEQFIQLVSNITTETQIILKSITLVKMNKKNNPYHDKILKHNIGLFNIGFDYESKMRLYDPNFVVKENKVGDHLNKCILFNFNTKKHYLFCEALNTIKTKFEINGEAINKSVFEMFLPKRNDNPIKVNSFCIDNVVGFILNNVEYNIV